MIGTREIYIEESFFVINHTADIITMELTSSRIVMTATPVAGIAKNCRMKARISSVIPLSARTSVT